MMTKQLIPPSAGNFSRPTVVGAAVLAVGLLFAANQASAARVDIVDGEGFESPYVAGTLEGQAAKLPNDAPFPGAQAWQASFGTTSTATVQGSTVHSGSQAVKLERAANEAPGGGQFGVPVTAWPDASRFVCIEWDMLVEDASGPHGSFGPYFGVFSYDDDGVGNSNGQTGSMGVDATTGDVLYQESGSGILLETGSTVNFNEWNHFHIDLDYLLHEYTVILNGVARVTESFLDGAGLDQFTDATLTAAAAAGDAISQALVGRAYYDNFEVYQANVKIPEPTSLALGMVAMVSLAGLSRRKR